PRRRPRTPPLRLRPAAHPRPMRATATSPGSSAGPPTAGPPGWRPTARRSSARTTTAGAGNRSEPGGPGRPGPGSHPAPELPGDVLGGEVGPGRGQEHRHVDGLDRETALDVRPEDRLPEEVDPGQPVPGRQVGLD